MGYMLRPVQISRNGEDYQVFAERDGEHALGRMYSTRRSPRGAGYAWFIYGSPRTGLAADLQKAQTEWEVAYERHRAGTP
jgi:hypothetical protein